MTFNRPTQPRFGQRGTATPPAATRPAKAATAPARLPRLLILAAWELCVFACAGAALLWAASLSASIKTAREGATHQVVAIINQPVTHLPRTAQAMVFSPGWFHPGAIKPDFATVDVRKTQESPYESETYVTSDINPSEMFLGSELEFNAMTKYFYVDRTLPKIRLSEDEMLQVNDLYRAIARSDQAMQRWWEIVVGATATGLLLAGAPLLVLWRRLEAA